MKWKGYDMIRGWKQNIVDLHTNLQKLSVRDPLGHEFDCDEAFKKWIDMALTIRNENYTIFFIGNGASASMASHFSADIRKNASITTQVFTDAALLTAYANDLSYEDVFAAPLRSSMKAKDMLVAISSSGESSNIIKAAAVAKEKGGTVVTLSAKKPNNALRHMGHLNFYIPAKTYGMAETSHAAILHYWTDRLTEDHF